MAVAQIKTVREILFLSNSDKEAIRKNAGKMAAILCNRNLLEGFCKLDVSEYYLLEKISPIFEEMSDCYLEFDSTLDEELQDNVLAMAAEIKTFLATLPPQKIKAEDLKEVLEEVDFLLEEKFGGTASDLLYQLLTSETISDEAKQEIVDAIL